MRRPLLLLVLALLILDASGLSALVLPESCPPSACADERVPDGSCPAFCVRCSCCTSAIVHTTSFLPEPCAALAVPVAQASAVGLQPVVVLDILHVPRRLLA